MQLLADAPTSRSARVLSQPCAFKALWFGDRQILIPGVNEDEILGLMLKTVHQPVSLARDYLLGLLNDWLLFLLSMHVNAVNFEIITLGMWTIPAIGRPFLQKTTCLNEIKSGPLIFSRTITRLPIELRLKILEYLVVDSTVIKAIGYSDGTKNFFKMKERGELNPTINAVVPFRVRKT